MPDVHFGPDTCTYRGRPADFVAHISFSYAGDTQLELIAPVTRRKRLHRVPRSRRARGCTTSASRPTTSTRRSARRRMRARRRRATGRDARRHGVRLPVSAEAAGVPYIEIAHIPPRSRPFFDYVKQEQAVSTEIPDTVDAADVTVWSDEVDVVVIGFGIAGGCAAVSAAAAGAKVLVLEKAAAAGGTSVDGGWPLLSRRRHRGAAGHRSRRQRRRDVQVPGRGVAASPTTTRSAPTATAASSTSTGWRTWAFSSSAASTRARSSSRPAPRGCPTPATRRCGRSASRRSPRRAATPCRCPASWAVPPWSSTCCVKRADELGVQIRYETGATNLVVDDGAVVGVALEALRRNRCDQSQVGHHRRRRLRDEPRDGRRAHPRAGPEAAHQAPRRGRALHPGQPQRRRPRHPDGRLGGRRRQEPGRAVHHRRRLPAGDPAHRRHRQQAGQAVRRRGLLPFAHLGFRAGTAGPDRPT